MAHALVSTTTTTKRRGTIRKWAPWVVYWLVVPIVAFEVVARFAFPSYAINKVYFPTLAAKVMMSQFVASSDDTDKRYIFRAKPHQDINASNEYFTFTAKINSLGCRGAEPSPKQPGEYRVMLVGDSAAFGMGLNEEDTISAQIARVAREQGADRPAVTAYNFGHPGYNLVQELIVLRDFFDAVRPDHVVLVLSVYTDNLGDVISALDAEGNFVFLKEPADNLLREISSYYGPLNWSMLFRMFQLKFLSTRMYYELSKRPDISQKSFALIDSFAAECRMKGAVFTAVNVYSPDAVKGGLHQLWNGSRKVHGMYTGYCRDNDIDVIDMLDFMSGYEDWKKYFFGEGHFNAVGARKAAEVIYHQAVARRLGTVALGPALSR
jgi:hypothetical protein